MKMIIYIIVGALFFLYIAISFIIYIYQEKIIFHPQSLPQNYRFNFKDNFEEVYLVNENEENCLHALWFKKNQKNQKVILYFHGNAGSLLDWGNVADDFVHLGYDILIIDYRTYGKSRGKLSQKILFNDAEKSLSFVKSHYKEENITLFGRSLGTGIASYLASICSPERLILETSYYNFISLVNQYVRIFPISLLLRYQFMTNQYLKKSNCPIYIFHGTKDGVIPYQQSQLLAEKLGLSAQNLITIENGGHNNLSDFAKYHKKMNEILKY